MRTHRSPMRLRVLTSFGLSSRSRSYSLIAGSILPLATSFSALAMTLSRWTAIFSAQAEQQLRLLHPFERFAMDRTRAVHLECGLMLFRRVSPVMLETVNGVLRMIRLHQEIAIDLRDDGSRGDGDTSLIPLNQRNLRHLQRFEQHRVEEQYVRTNGEIVDGLEHGQLAGPK